MNKIEEILKELNDIIWGTEPEPKRARGKKGRYKADDKSTEDYWVMTTTADVNGEEE